MKSRMSASLMCVDFLNAGRDLRQMEEAGIDLLHFDIMDGSFVPNYTLGSCFVDGLRGRTSIEFDIHLMVEKPEDKIGFFNICEGDWVSVHAEATVHLQRLLARLRGLGAKAGVAINPATPVCVLENVLDDLDFVLIMTVNPGYAGQKLIPHTLKKITQVRKMLDDAGMQDKSVQVDGNVSFENAIKMKQAGADNYVLGSSGLFLKDMSIAQAAAKMRQCIE